MLRIIADGSQMKASFVEKKKFGVLQVVAILLFLIDRKSIEVFSISGISATIFLDTFTDLGRDTRWLSGRLPQIPQDITHLVT